MITHWDDAPTLRRETGGFVAGTWTLLGEHSVSIGLRRIRIDPGRFSTPAHVHGAEEELHYILGGHGLSWQAGETYEVAAGDLLVHLGGAEPHTLHAGEDGLDVLAFGQRVRDEALVLPRAGVLWAQRPGHWVELAGGPTPWEREAAAGPPELPPPSLRPSRIANLRDCPPREVAHGDSQLVVRDLGRAAGSRTTGLRHQVVAPGKLGWPPHCHSAEEELLVVLEGEGELLLGDERRDVEIGGGRRRPAGVERIPVRRGHVVARPPATRVPHAFRAGPGGLTYLAYGTRDPNDIGYYPRSQKVYLRGIGVMARLDQLEYWDGEPDA